MFKENTISAASFRPNYVSPGTKDTILTMKHFGYYEHSEYGQQIVLHDSPSFLLEI